MNIPSLNQLVPILQLAIGPVILISGIGLLLLSLTNRLGRMVDRSRQLAREHAQLSVISQTDRVQLQIDILFRRANILRISITLGAVALLLVSILILILFVSALLKLESGLFIVILFCTSQLCLIGSILAFIRDMNLALVALKLEVKR